MFYTSDEIIKEISTPTLRIRLLKNSIIHYTFTSEVDIGLEDAIINHHALINSFPPKPPLIIDATAGIVNLSRSSIDFIKSKEATTPLVGRAFVTSSLANKLLISINYKLNPSMYPFKVFTKYGDAQSWLISLIN